MVNLDILKSPMLANGAIAGAGIVFVLSTIVATVVFDEAPGANSTIAPQEIQMAMQVFPTEQHIKVWMDAVLLLHITVDIMNISKVLPDGEEEPDAGLVDLFPVDGPAVGKGQILFKMRSAEKEEMPNLLNRTQEVIPMAYIMKESFPPILQSLLKFCAVNLNNFGIILGLAVMYAVGLIVVGVGLLYLDKKQSTSAAESEADD